MNDSTRGARRRQRKRWLGGAVAASSLLSTPALADDHQSYGGGVFFGYRFGVGSTDGAASPDSGFEWGFEAFTTYLLRGEGCSSERRTGLGPLVQVGLLGTEQPRFTVALQGGGELNRATFALTGALGLSYRGGGDAGFGVHTSVLPESFFVNAGLHYEWFLEQGWLGGGMRLLPTYGEPNLCKVEVGRPLRGDAGVLQLPVLRPALDDRHARRGRAAVEPVGLAFERDAQHEAASVPAFLQLASELADAHAPAALIRDALHAAADEQRHTRLTAQLAETHLGRPIAIDVPEITPRRALPSAASTLRLALESWLDGCCAEGRAAAHAAAASSRAEDPATRAVLARIAADEQRHAELAWSILRWALRAGGDDARDAVHELAGATTDDSAVAREHAPQGFECHGRLAADTLNAVAREHHERSRARLRSALASAALV
jgi:hypothetical protein